MQLIKVDTAADIMQIKELFREYAASLNFDLSFQDFETELAELPGAYAPPAGSLLMAVHDGQVAGCIALRNISGAVCEMKRLYVRPEYRGLGIGKSLALAIIKEAKQIGYHKLRLDTVASMKEAIKLYRNLGFREIEAYRFNPIAGAAYMELDLLQLTE